MDVECEVSQLVYKFRKLDELEILSVEELSSADVGPGAASPGSGVDAPLEVVARLMAQPRSRARPSRKRPPTVRVADSAAIAEIVDEALVADEIDDALDQELLPLANAELEQPLPPPPPPPPFEDTLEQFVRETELPKWDAETGQIHNPIDNKIIGRARVLDKGTKKERVTLYCRLHQCYPPPLSKKRALPIDKICEWLDEGLTLPHGKDGKCAHMAMWRKMEAAYHRQ